MRETNPDYINKIKEYDRERKRKERELKSSRSETSSRSEMSTPTKQTPPSYYKILNRSKQIHAILGPSPSTHTSVLKHVLKKTMKSPRKSKDLRGMVSKLLNKRNVTPGKNGNVSKELRKIAVLKSKQRHDKAQDITEKLKAQYQTVTQIAREACDDKKSVYRILSPPKQQKKGGIFSKTQ